VATTVGSVRVLREDLKRAIRNNNEPKITVNQCLNLQMDPEYCEQDPEECLETLKVELKII